MIHVTCAIIEQNGKVLICQRSEKMNLPLKWEFPGGKIEANESKSDCLKREIREELGLIIKVGKELAPVVYNYPEFTICLSPFLCTLISGKLILSEHAQALWVNIQSLGNYDWAEADKPIVCKLMVE